VIKDVEELTPETKTSPLGQTKTRCTPISAYSAEPAQHIAAEIALLAGGRCSEGGLVEDLAAGIPLV
jgi:hypothetical protein